MPISGLQTTQARVSWKNSHLAISAIFVGDSVEKLDMNVYGETVFFDIVDGSTRDGDILLHRDSRS